MAQRGDQGGWDSGHHRGEDRRGAIEDNPRLAPIHCVVVFAGEGFSSNMRAYLISTGRAIELEDAQKWLELYFGL
jgi:hypothetical protein